MARLWLVIGKGETVRIGTGLSRQKKKRRWQWLEMQSTRSVRNEQRGALGKYGTC